MKSKILVLLVILPFSIFAGSLTPGDTLETATGWQKPPANIMKVLHAPQLPMVWTSPTGEYMFLADPILYPPLSELGGPMYKLAGMRVNPLNNNYHGDHGGTSPRLLNIDNGSVQALELPKEAEILAVNWTVDGKQFALLVGFADRVELWTGTVNGKVKKIEKLQLNPLLGNTVSWLPDQKRLIVFAIPKRGEAPKAPAIPYGPEIMQGEGSSARSTYEARNLLETDHDEALFEYYTKSELIIVDPANGALKPIGKPDFYTEASFSPDGKYILIERLVKPWSHEVAYWRFATEIEVWNEKGAFVAKIASLPLADNVPVHGERQGPRTVSWRPTAPNSLFWVEALDGGDPTAKVSHRDRLMSLSAPFTGEPKEVFKAEHRIIPYLNAWGAESGLLILTQNERMRRWNYTWLLDVDKGTSRLWYDLNQSDRYNNPGSPLMRQLPNGKYVFHEKDGAVYYRGSGSTDKGDRPFLDLRYLESGKTKRLFRCDPNKYEYFVAFAGNENQLVIRSESATEVPNYYLTTLGEEVEAEKGEAALKQTRKPITQFEDPTPELRNIEKRIVRYFRNDSVPLNFTLHLPPGYKEGTRLPTVLYAYPLEYSGAATAGQVSGSSNRFMRVYGASHLYFLLQGYAVLDATAMPMIGDPETTYNTFVKQLVADAEAAVNKAVEIGVADPNKIGIIGHSHGALMVATLLAHTDLFTAGIARSGSYNKTNQPFGFQSERRSLFDAQDVYIQVSPTFVANKVNEPVLIIHGKDDGNPGTRTYQSEVFYEAVRGAGGTARLVLLPFEDHGYSAVESIEHVLWEQIQWFDKYVKNAKPKQ